METELQYCCKVVLTVSIFLPSFDPLIIKWSTPISSHIARATVVLPTPAPPDKSKLGILPSSTKP